jgi:hypothetical protein
LSEPRRRCSTGASTSPADAVAHAEVNRLMAG